MPESPVTPAVVKWAIDESGMSLENIASRVDEAEASDIQAWMHGTAGPKKGQLTKLAEALKRPRAMFFLPEPPEESLPVGLRRPAGTRSTERPELTFDERLWVRRARHLQEILATLSQRRPGIPDLPWDRNNAADAAVSLRNWMGVRGRQDWKDASAAFRGWRTALEAKGVAVLAVSMKKEGVRGFALKHSQAPLIAVNTADIPEARCFTLFHELAHLANGGDSSCAGQTVDGLERWCDRVASRILMPRDQLDRFVKSSRHTDLDLVQYTASHFKVSRLAAAVALEDAGTVERAYARVVEQWPSFDREKGGSGGGGRRRPKICIDEYGDFAVRTIIDALQDGRINELDASEYLRLDRTLLSATRKQLSA